MIIYNYARVLIVIVGYYNILITLCILLKHLCDILKIVDLTQTTNKAKVKAKMLMKLIYCSHDFPCLFILLQQ